MERRQHRRVPVQVQGFLLGNSHETEAMTLDLSVGGAQFECDLEQAAEKPLWQDGNSMVRSFRTTGEHRAGCSKRPSSKAAVSEDARRTLRYVELLSDARTKLADFFSILLSLPRQGDPCATSHSRRR